MPRWFSPAKRKVLKALVKGSLLLPYHAATAATATSGQRSGAFRFGSAYSAKTTLSSAVVDCINSVRQQLGPDSPPHLCQLLVTPDIHGSNIEYAPSFVRECLSSKENEPPVVIGGAVQGLLVNNDSQVAGVSLFAAHMPGVELMPFHVTNGSLPELTEAQWIKLMKATMKGHDAADKVSAILLTEPHFTQSHELIPRIRGALAGSPLVGGLVHDNAWGSNPWGGKRSLRGALFMNNKVYDEGAVGCIMKGSLQMDVICEQNCRPIGHIATVTESQGNTILGLDHEQVIHAVCQMVDALPAKDRKLLGGTMPVLGVDVTGTGTAFVPRRCKVPSYAHQGAQALEVPCEAVPEGSLVQLQILDPAGSRNRLQAQLQRYVSNLPSGVANDPAQLGSMLFSCKSLQSNEEDIMQAALPGVPFQGAQFLAQFGLVSGGNGEQSLAQGYSRTFGLLRQLQV